MTKQALKQHSSAYATSSDFCQIFTQDMNNLYQLALLLTADVEKAEQCFVAGLDECSQTNRVFQEWAASWARRMIIQNAVRLLAPTPVPSDSSHGDLIAARSAGAYHALPELRAEMSVILGLPTFDRFVFAMSVLEGYSDQESALMLGCTRPEVMAARVRAMQHIAQSVNVEKRSQTASANTTSRQSGNSPLAFAIAAGLATPA